jgi:2-polyprenyl-6-hydroxyphenyl methylase/3-demethylubiquinone-9 3-methyltransferase
LHNTVEKGRFAFGRNWASYVRLVDEERIREAERGLVGLLGSGEVSGRTFLDVGCGSGVHALAAARLGAARIAAIDIDPQSVAATRGLFARYPPSSPVMVEERSLFALAPDAFGQFDIVYCWGVLHHTGKLRDAIRWAAGMVVPGGVLVLALYRRTRLCGFWAWEKRWYAEAPPGAQRLARSVYAAAMTAGLLVTGRGIAAYMASYRRKRGMDFWHDLHDWLGGHPYESMSAEEVETIMRSLSFRRARSVTRPGGWGFLGSGCNEYVYLKRRD